jgi:hypothetical protein
MSPPSPLGGLHLFPAQPGGLEASWLVYPYLLDQKEVAARIGVSR